MHVRLTTGRAGADFSHAPGEVVTVDEAEGKRLLDSGQAETVKGAARQTAAVSPAERKAVQPASKPRKKKAKPDDAGSQPDKDGSPVA